jgi:hypothetical protein
MERVVSSLNRTIGESERLLVDLVQWETHACSGFGADAQDVINRQIEPGDIFMGVLWRRIGTPTQRAISGTVEEFERAHELWLRTGRPTLMVYFKTPPFYPSQEDLTQFRSVLDFNAQLKKKRGQGYRTLRGIARATSLPEAEVKRVIETQPELIMKSRIPDAEGAALFKLRS